MIQLETKYIKIIKTILDSYPYDFFLFGSRAKNQAEKFSDVDICFKDPIPDHVVSAIRADLDDSDLPFRVDLVSYDLMDQEFRDKIEAGLIKL